MTSANAATDASLLAVPSAESGYRVVNGVRLHVVAAGDTADPLVVLLHGFPEWWYAWRRYVGPLVEAGYRVLVPDQRGYNLSEKPRAVRAYAVWELVADVADLIATTGATSAHVIGHDWGAFVAWHLALRRPERVDHLGIINVPHPTAFRCTLRSNPRQVLASWYALFFQVPWLPEWLASRNDFQQWVDAMAETAQPGTFTAAEWSHYRAAWRQPGAPKAMVNWYRAIGRYGDRPPSDHVRPPTMVIWGDRDHALVPDLAAESAAYCADGRLERFPNATHWVHHERPTAVTRLLVDHLEETNA